MTREEYQISENYREFECGLFGWDCLGGAMVESVSKKGIDISVKHPDNPDMILRGFASFYAPVGSIITVSIITKFEAKNNPDGSKSTRYLFRVEGIEHREEDQFIVYNHSIAS